MESNKDSKTSSEETDSAEQVDDAAAGTGRSYECMFCRRGFSTAQALGGHMNIHRKDRARIRQQHPVVQPKPGEEYYSENYGYFPSYQNHRPTYSPVVYESSMKSYATYFPAAGSTSAAAKETRSFDEDGSVAQSPRAPRELSLFGEDQLHLRLSMHVGGRLADAAADDDDDVKKSDEDDEIDLELRLGPDQP